MVVGICDDIPEYVTQISQIAKEYFKREQIEYSIKTFLSGRELLDYDENIDILLLDIELGDFNAIELINSFRQKYRNTLIIIITSYQHYLDKAMDLEILRYIDKPIETGRVFDALERAIELLDNSRIVIKSRDNKIYNLNKTDIIYIESYLKQTVIYTVSGNIEMHIPIKELRQLLSNTSFLASPHYSYIVNYNFIKRFSRSDIIMDTPQGEAKVPIASRNQGDFKKKYLNYMKDGYSYVKNDN